MFSVGSYSGNSVRCASRCSAARRSSVRASVRSVRCRRRRASSPAGWAHDDFGTVVPHCPVRMSSRGWSWRRKKGRRCGQIVGAERFVGAFKQPCVERAADDRDDIPPFRGGYVRFGDGSGRQRFAFRKGEPERLKGCDECLHGIVFFGVRTVPEASRALRNGFGRCRRPSSRMPPADPGRADRPSWRCGRWGPAAADASGQSMLRMLYFVISERNACCFGSSGS